MTEREPFSEQQIRDEFIISRTLDFETSAFCWTFCKDDGPHAAELANYAYKIGTEKEVSARVKEAEKKAVEAFRERAAKVAELHSEDVNGHCGCMDEIAAKILALPTEPEENSDGE